MTNMKMKRFFPLLLCALLLLCACSQNAGGGEEEALRSRIAALESQNEGKDKALAENASLLSELAQEKESLAAEIERLQEEKIRFIGCFSW